MPETSTRSSPLSFTGSARRGNVHPGFSARAYRMRERVRRTALRRGRIGFVYQYHHLLPEFSAEENVLLPQMIAGVGRTAGRARARDLLGRLGLADRIDNRPGQLSGGEQQRVALARALAKAPAIVQGHEPTRNHDPVTPDEVFARRVGLARDAGLAAVIATHNPALAARMDRSVRLEGGRLVEV